MHATFKEMSDIFTQIITFKLDDSKLMNSFLDLN